MNLTEIFNNREIAIAIWIFLFIAWALTKTDLRRSLKSLLRAACQKSILITFGY